MPPTEAASDVHAGRVYPAPANRPSGSHRVQLAVLSGCKYVLADCLDSSIERVKQLRDLPINLRFCSLRLSPDLMIIE